MISTKIVATIGPACDTEENIEALIKAGVNVFRFNLKHTVPEWHKERVERVRAISQKHVIPVAILFDLQGPEIRTGDVSGGEFELTEGEEVTITNGTGYTDRKQIIIPHEGVVSELQGGSDIRLDNDRIRLRVLRVEPNGIVVASVLLGGVLGSHKSVVIPTLSQKLSTLTERDKDYIRLAKEQEVEYLALSYVRGVSDMTTLREEMQHAGGESALVAKIETKEAVDTFENILAISDAVMVARGDLGVQLPIEQVPFYQKHIIRRCLEVGKPVITATQMLETMVDHPFPTRAEVSDVANAIFDYTDAIMLSAETASGDFPVESVEVMKKTATFIEAHLHIPRVSYGIGNSTDTIIHAASELASKQQTIERAIKAFVVLTESGYAARMLARYRLSIPIIALTPHERVRNQLLLVWGVSPFLFPFVPVKGSNAHVTEIDEMLRVAKETGFVSTGDNVIVVHGSDWGRPGVTNVVRIEKV